ncbi:MAG TPA: RDD family protein [Chryseosolibacter sp.]|nr:RDD family protein [Chryseosolibacter sp.]
METLDSTTTTSAISTTNYAGFLHRLGAIIIDGIIIGILQSVVITPILAMVGFGMAADIQNAGGDVSEAEAMGMIAGIMAAAMGAWLTAMVVGILYYSILESSKFQGTVGKMAVGIKVTDMNGDRISFGKALLRSIGRQISGLILFIGYLMAAFTEKKQALHDMIAGTLVLKK